MFGSSDLSMAGIALFEELNVVRGRNTETAHKRRVLVLNTHDIYSAIKFVSYICLVGTRSVLFFI